MGHPPTQLLQMRCSGLLNPSVIFVGAMKVCPPHYWACCVCKCSFCTCYYHTKKELSPVL